MCFGSIRCRKEEEDGVLGENPALGIGRAAGLAGQVGPIVESRRGAHGARAGQDGPPLMQALSHRIHPSIITPLIAISDHDHLRSS